MSVKFFRLDRKKVNQDLAAYANRLAEQPRVLAVVLFGSHARSQATAMSDADILVILDSSPVPFDQRIAQFPRAGAGINLDIFPYTLQEARQSLKGGWGVVPIALKEGAWLVDKAGVKNELQRQPSHLSP